MTTITSSERREQISASYTCHATRLHQAAPPPTLASPRDVMPAERAATALGYRRAAS